MKNYLVSSLSCSFMASIVHIVHLYIRAQKLQRCKWNSLFNSVVVIDEQLHYNSLLINEYVVSNFSINELTSYGTLLTNKLKD